MKKNYLLMTVLVAVTVFGAGCSEEESSVVEDSNELNITTNIVESSTKSVVSSFSSSTIGVFVDDDADVYSPTTNSTASVSTGDNSVTVDPTIYITADATVYAYYPATADELTSPTSASTKDITVVSADDFAATSQTDYLWATPVNVIKTYRTADLTFQHALSKVIFSIKKVDDFSGTGALSKISLTASDDTYKFLSGSGTMGISDGSISGLTATDNLTYTESSAITLSTTAQEAVAIVAPATLAANTSATSTITITLTIDDYPYSTTLPVSETSEWAAGNTYTYNITVKNGELEIGIVSITDWVSNNETSLDVEPVITYAES